MPLSPEAPGPEDNRVPEVESHSAYVNLFLQADASIAATVSIKEMERLGIEPTPWQIAFGKMHKDLETKVKNHPKPSYPREFVTPVDTFVVRPATILVATDSFKKGGIHPDAIEPLLHVVYMLGYELHSREDIERYFPRIVAILENFGGLRLQDSVSQSQIGQILGVGHHKWREQNPIPRGFRIAYNWRTPVPRVIEEGVGNLPQLPGPGDPPSAFADFIRELDSLDEL